MNDDVPSANEAYGQLKANLFIAGFTLERAFRNFLEPLLTGDGWKLCGPGYDNVNAFMDSLRLDKFRVIADERKKIVHRIKELQPAVSNRQIARTLGVDHVTVSNDIRGENSPRGDGGSRHNDGAGGENSAPAPADRAEYQTPIVPPGLFSTIVVDPPWDMEKIEREVRPNQVGFDYPTMSVEQLTVWPVVTEKAAADCHLFCWTTQKWLPSAIRLVDAWGFRYCLTMVWHKPGGFQPVRLPQYNCEFVIYARRGAPRFLDTKNFPCCFTAPRREHSRKPDEFYGLIRRVGPEPRIDIFSREPRDGFEQYGNEVGKFAA